MALVSTRCAQCISLVHVLRSSHVQRNGLPVLREAQNRRNIARFTYGVSGLSRSSLCGALSHPEAPTVLPESDIEGLSGFLDSLKWDSDGLVAAIVQHIDTGDILMQGYADRAAVAETLQTRLVKERWSGYPDEAVEGAQASNVLEQEQEGEVVQRGDIWPLHKSEGRLLDCDRDSLIYLGEPIGPACHTGAPTCWFTEVEVRDGKALEEGTAASDDFSPATTLQALERTIADRVRTAQEAGPSSGQKPSWTAKLAANPELLCKKVREEAGELCQTLEQDEGPERAASEAADLFYHALVLLNVQGVPMETVLQELRRGSGPPASRRRPRAESPDEHQNSV